MDPYHGSAGAADSVYIQACVCVFVLSSFRTGTGSAAERRPCATEHVSFFSTRRQWGGGVSESRRVAEQPEARRGHALQYGL